MNERRLAAARELIEALRAPACYAHPVRFVEVRETHVSWVLLTGAYAYKIKKPVVLPFLDFSTLERRRYFCEEELRLNRRFAPSLYLDVVPISVERGRPRVGEHGEVREYAVRLRQFSAEDELIALLQRDALKASDFADLGARLADIHEVAARADEHSGFGDAQHTMQSVRSTCDELAELLDEPGRTVLDALRMHLESENASLRTMFEERLRSGRVRECHGDLHAGNIVRVDGVLTPFDCIEFDPALRWIDVMNDVAFLVADLSARGRRDHAYAFLNAWLERSGDYAAVRLLRHFAIYRALVRAKVGLLSGTPTERNAGPRPAEYLDLAQALSRARRPRLVLTCGLSGSGKTWLSTRWLTHMPAIRVRSDVERKRLAGLAATESSASAPGAGIYTPEFNERTYGRLRTLAGLALRAGEHCIVDAAFLRRAERAAFLELAHEHGLAPAIVYCTAPRALLEQRILDRARRRSDASEATIGVLNRQYDYWEAFDATEQRYVIEVNTADDQEVGRALARLNA